MTNEENKAMLKKIRVKQDKLNSLVSKYQFKTDSMTKEILRLSCELDKLIVEFHLNNENAKSKK